MLDVLDSVKQEYLDDSVHKDIVIPFVDTTTDVSGVNWYIGDVGYGYHQTSLTPQKDVILWCNYDGTTWDTYLDNYVYKDYLKKADYVYISGILKITAYTDLPSAIQFAAHYRNSHGGYGGNRYLFNPSQYLDELTGDGLRVYTRINTVDIDDAFEFTQLALYCPQSTTIDITYEWGDIQVQSSNDFYTTQDFYNDAGTNPLPYLGESIIRQGQDPLDYITIGKDPIPEINNEHLEFQSFRIQENLCSSDNLKFGACEASYANFTVYNRNDAFKGREIAPYITTDSQNDLAQIPLGIYTISEVKKTESHNLTKTEITAYDKLTLLDQNAANWYTRYMYAYSTTTYQAANGFECTRQIYSSYFNIAKTLGIERMTDYEYEEIGTYNLIPEPGTYPYITNKYSTWLSTPIPPSSASNACRIHYSKITINDPDPSFPYVIDATLAHVDRTFESDEYAAQVDEYMRGVTTANIIITETRDNVIYPSNTFVVDSGDFFMLSPDCTSIDIYLPTCMWLPQLGFDNGAIVQSIKVSKVNKNIDLTNGSTRLMYYNWNTHDIFPCDSSITARDVVRSLLEVCGCLYKLDRYGKPKFLYPTMSALYPSNTLYPADDLYPRGSNGDILPMAKYSSFDYEDYMVQNIGRIQIVKKQTSDSTKSICEWEYEGNPDAINTYLIDDNIFYCSDKMEYEYDSMAEVSEMLVNMYSRISNMKYTPHLTKALGMPWIEVGDRIGLLTTSGGIESFIYRRTLKGVQVLNDTYEAEGDEYTEKVKDYNYKVWEE